MLITNMYFLLFVLDFYHIIAYEVEHLFVLLRNKCSSLSTADLKIS